MRDMRLKHGNDRINFLRYICHIYLLMRQYKQITNTTYMYITVLTILSCAMLNSRTVFIFTTPVHVKQDEDFVILGNEHSYSHIPDERVLMVLK